MAVKYIYLNYILYKEYSITGTKIGKKYDKENLKLKNNI